MSWWDSAGLGSLVSQGLKHAQKKIDKVLDISEDAKSKASSSSSSYTFTTTSESLDEESHQTASPKALSPKSVKSDQTSEDDSFWQNWGLSQASPSSPSAPSNPIPYSLNLGSARSAFSIVSKKFNSVSGTTTELKNEDKDSKKTYAAVKELKDEQSNKGDSIEVKTDVSDTDQKDEDKVTVDHEKEKLETVNISAQDTGIENGKNETLINESADIDSDNKGKSNLQNVSVESTKQVEEDSSKVEITTTNRSRHPSLNYEVSATDDTNAGWEVSLDGELIEDPLLMSDSSDVKNDATVENTDTPDNQPHPDTESEELATHCTNQPKERESDREATEITDSQTTKADVSDAVESEVPPPLCSSESKLLPAGGADDTDEIQQPSYTSTQSDSVGHSDTTMVESTDTGSQHENKPSNEASTSPALEMGTDMTASSDSKTDTSPEVTESTIKLDEGQQLQGSYESSQDDLSDSNRTLTAEDFQVEDIETDNPDADKSDQNSDERKDIEESQTAEKEREEAEETQARQVEGEVRQDVEKCESAEGGKSAEGNHTAGGNLSTSSYVRSLLEEAMVESVKEAESQSCSSSERSSDLVRIGSGHTSGDEMDTTTSSDIEVISTPTPNGDGRLSDSGRLFDLSPLRHALSRGIRNSSQGHTRTSSEDSGRSHDLDTQSHDTEENRAQPETKEHGEIPKSDPENPLETDKLLKTIPEVPDESPVPGLAATQASEPLSVEMYEEKLSDMAEVLEAREKKLVEMSRENMDLHEANSILRHQLQQLEEAREAEMTDVNQLTAEFAVRIGEAEKKIQTVLREKEVLKKQLQRAEAEIMKKSDNSAFEMLLKEKEQQIAELLAEGEKLSKQQLQTNNIVKKLRVKEKENETLIKNQKQKLEDQKKEVEHLRKVCDAKEELEKKQTEAIHQLNTAVKKQDSETQRLRGDLEEAQDKNRSLQTALDNSYKEIADLHKAKATKASEAQEAALSAEMLAKQELQKQMDRYAAQARLEQESLVTQIEDLQLSMGRVEKEHNRREDILRQEISDLQQRLQDAEARNQDLTQGVTAATRPLLRQIENLQSTYAAQCASYEKVEKNLTERLSDAQTQLAASIEKERAATESHLDLSARQASLESQISTLRQERSRLTAQLEMERTKLEVLEDAKNNDAAQMESLKGCYEREISELKKEKMLAEHQLEMEKMRVETEKKKLQLAHEQLREKDAQLQSRASVSPALSRDGSITSDVSASFTTISQEEVLEKTLMISSSNGSLRSSSLYESMRQSGAANLLESLQSQLKQKEGEIQQLQSEIHELERTRESMARELVNLTNRLEELEETAQAIPEYQRQHKELDTRYQALLQMYGEKVEETEELKLDLVDVKEMYKAQIEELLKA